MAGLIGFLDHHVGLRRDADDLPRPVDDRESADPGIAEHGSHF